MFICVAASGTNIQRMAKTAGGQKIHGVLNAAYSELEDEIASNPDDKIVRRKYYMLQYDNLLATLHKDINGAATWFNSDHSPKWSVIWKKPSKCKGFLGDLTKAIIGESDEYAGLNISSIADEEIKVMMFWTSANNEPMTTGAKIIQDNAPDYSIVTLNGDENYTNRDAQKKIKNEIRWAKHDGKKGVIIISNMMGSRSFSVSEIQANIIMYDNGSVDALAQRVSRPLTPGLIWDGTIKEFGHIFSLSFDNNRNENIENLILYEAITRSKSENISFAESLKKVARSINVLRVDCEGDPELIQYEDLVRTYSDNENLLKVADVTVDLMALLDSPIYDILCDVKVGKTSNGPKIKELVPKRTTSNGDGDTKTPKELSSNEEKEIKKAEKLINEAIQSINRSSTTVYNMTMRGGNYRECLLLIDNNLQLREEFNELYGILPSAAILLVDDGILNTPLLDVIVQNSAIESQISLNDWLT